MIAIAGYTRSHVPGCNCPTGEINCVDIYQPDHLCWYICREPEIKPKPHSKFVGKSPWQRSKKR